jgi:putative SOS response-associated peptidase YedK
MARWGLDLRGKPVSNARSETVFESSFFRRGIERGRVIVPATGWYEWTGPAGQKQPHHLSVDGDDALALAGLCERGQDGVDRYAIITKSAQTEISSIHDRMPVILSRERWQVWLADTPLAQIRDLLLESEEHELVWWPVTKRVSNWRNDDQGVILPLEDAS